MCNTKNNNDKSVDISFCSRVCGKVVNNNVIESRFCQMYFDIRQYSIIKHSEKKKQNVFETKMNPVSVEFNYNFENSL